MEPTIAERLDQYPELKRPDGDCIGRITCEYCSTVYPGRWQYNEHLRTKKRCKTIRTALGIPVLEDKTFPCIKCGKEYSTANWRNEHQWKCPRGMLTIIPLEVKEPPGQLTTKKFEEDGESRE